MSYNEVEINVNTNQNRVLVMISAYFSTAVKFICCQLRKLYNFLKKALFFASMEAKIIVKWN